MACMPVMLTLPIVYPGCVLRDLLLTEPLHSASRHYAYTSTFEMLLPSKFSTALKSENVNYRYPAKQNCKKKILLGVLFDLVRHMQSNI